ncbi:DUF72 domain-containing protein [Verticiella sediminum]|uniref:DUF72 domain-containing protein n=1 Tax=Verticiella sediminum TaxID=1247510 RepID=A0A556AYJ5_9BURK|nr:DUF72 domain-containing protein [Verticiella sediminum]TSH98013.1 DUF72 domain-containing protein [Verticiella sediminum]
MSTARKPGAIRVGIGGWRYAPWRETFYPPGLPEREQLAWASRRLSAIEVNATFYRTQTRDTYASWHAATPPGFRLALKAPRYAVQRRTLAEAGPAIATFVESGIDALQAKLGPILWQLTANYAYDEADLAAFCALLPQTVGKRRLHHVLQVRHASFTPERCQALAERHAVAVAHTDDPQIPGHPGGGVFYARMLRARSEIETGYPDDELDELAREAARWARQASEVYVFVINGAKERAPAAAQALLGRLDAP